MHATIGPSAGLAHLDGDTETLDPPPPEWSFRNNFV